MNPIEKMRAALLDPKFSHVRRSGHWIHAYHLDRNNVTGVRNVASLNDEDYFALIKRLSGSVSLEMMNRFTLYL